MADNKNLGLYSHRIFSTKRSQSDHQSMINTEYNSYIKQIK